MIVDTSAILAVLIEEPDAAIFDALLSKTPGVRLSAGSWVELAAVLLRRFRGMHDATLAGMMAEWRIEIAPVTTTQAHLAALAYRTYGIGTGHPARLNFGDCFAYALAKETGEPLLFKGDDFGRTDVVPAIR
ncbi:type II toxin-antitoxin system VapC family toxin [Sphingomonas sp. KR1UV-12]|uniref:Ribonuclease VapC n=1 Tax=Sphingomonas aurea TaxID=3063994 RepID=A0ABT9EFQ0_9SPHN|nr:type II toxin-antitoxin system VapC family toxin [Sphingomonas sp. KR1UV-12]MDP1025618.1 type II toxin-antitoxin system VapC family toxin [Sphingomonas sp. KR1UV-12]